MRRYGIEAVLLESYDDIPNVLEKVEKQCNLRNLFISGSISVDTEIWTTKQAEEFAKTLSNKLAAEKMHITSGYGLGIGSAVITGVLDEVKNKKYAHFDDYLKLYPFPQPVVGEDFVAIWHEYRKEMIADCGVAIFIFGNKKDTSGKCVAANGMIDEYEIANEKKAILIPIASTGEAAEKIYIQMFSERTKYPYLEKYWDILKTERSPEILAKVIIEIINSVSVY
ncbi:hypothetical protein L0P85_06360 [Terrisporobacter glycolicus]|nr:hypothetical protein L0P85_06360 [Terrisporobacter glycolicus]